MKPNGATKLLCQRLDDNPRLPVLTRHVMKSLAYGDDAARVWRVFGSDDDTVGKVVSRVRSALEQSMREVARPSIKNEREDIENIINLITRLQHEIKVSMPGDRVTLFEHELSAEDLPPVDLDLGWHSLRPSGYNNGYPLAVNDVLTWALVDAKKHLQNLPTRAVIRRSDKPEVQAFVRHLAWQFAREFGKEYRGTIGYIVTAIFSLEDPLDAKAVEGILKDRPAPFKAPT